MEEHTLEVLSTMEPAIGKAASLLEAMALDREERELYELRRKAILDFNSATAEAEARGEFRGKEEKAIETARAALKKNLSPEDISEITGLSLDTVTRLQQELN